MTLLHKVVSYGSHHDPIYMSVMHIQMIWMCLSYGTYFRIKYPDRLLLSKGILHGKSYNMGIYTSLYSPDWVQS